MAWFRQKHELRYSVLPLLAFSLLVTVAWAEPPQSIPATKIQPAGAVIVESSEAKPGGVLQAFVGLLQGTTESKPDIAADDPRAIASHEQTAILKISPDGEPKVKAYAFCLSKDGNLLVGCGQGPGEIRVLSPEGKILDKWSIDIKPDAMNIGPDGMVYVAGGGKILKLSEGGEILLTKDAPHVSHLMGSREALAENIKSQAKQRAKSYETMIKQRQTMIDKLEEKPEADRTDAEKRRLASYKQVVEQLKGIVKKQGGTELTEEQLEKQVDAAIRQKSLVSSISVTDSAVYVTCRMVKGYGFEVWRLNGEFEDAKQIVEGLRGCCGQMDVHARGNELFVAENARHRVARYSNDGKLLNTWGKGDRKGIEGFGSCCNPMNVCFGPGEIVYTAEDTTGRIKKYKPDGTLLGVVGRVKVVPGCKDVSIAATPDGKTVYMVDITRGQIVVMTEKDAAENKQTNTPQPAAPVTSKS